MGKRSLQIATALFACVPVTVGSLALYFGVRSPLYNVIGECVTATLDSNFRFMAGAWFGLGVAGFWLIPRIERETSLFRAIWFAIFCGGLGRIISLFESGRPEPLYTAFIAVELLGAPIFIYWQTQVAKAAATA
jgi:hypothetical protein